MMMLVQIQKRGCHLQDEPGAMQRPRNFERFQQLYYELWPLVQSLPELLHHLEAKKRCFYERSLMPR